MRPNRQGFTLVELSIVLVIIGLLVGGILVGQSLIHASELRSITTQRSQFSTAMNAFRDKYLALPGDLTTATSFWGKDNTNCPGNPGTAAAAGAGVCNGNGDSFITYNNTANSPSEPFQAWRHLAYAGLIEGTYSGISGWALDSVNGTAPMYTLGQSSPSGKFAGSAWGMGHINNSGGQSNAFWFQRDYSQYLSIGTLDNLYADNPFITAADASNIDFKMDDAKPATGKVQATYWSGTIPCTTAATATDFDASYKSADPTAMCALLFAFQ